jgi:hypothetical protein
MRRILSFAGLALLAVGCGNALAQRTSVASDSSAINAGAESNPALSARTDAAQLETSSEPQQTKRILGIIPNFRAVSSVRQLPPQSVKEKFMTMTEDSFDYSSIAIPAALAGYGLARNATPEFGTGGAGYGRYLWHSAIDQTSENYMVEFVMPVLTHEGTRFYTLESGSFLRRTEYALTRAVITRSDSGSKVINLSEIVGSGASAGLSNAYYPAQERSFANTGTQWGLDIGIDAAAFFAKEFWPDINRHLFHSK